MTYEETLPEISEPTTPRWLLALVILVPLIIAGLSYRYGPSGLGHADAMDYAQLARNILRGRGYTTYVLRPLLAAPALLGQPVPDTTHGPLYPGVLALLFGILGVRDNVVILFSEACYVVTTFCLFLLGRRLFTPLTGAVAALAYAVHARTIEQAASGLPITLQALMFTALALALAAVLTPPENGDLWMLENRTRTLCVAIGALLAGLCLSDPFFVLLAPLVLVYLYRNHAIRDAGGPLSVTIILLGLLAPWWYWLGHASGNPVLGGRWQEVRHMTLVNPGALYRLFATDLKGAYAAAEPLRLAMDSVNRAFGVTFGILGGAVLGVFLLSCLVPLEGVHRQVRKFCMLSLVVLLVSAGIFPYGLTANAAIVPLVIVFAAAFLEHLVVVVSLPPRQLAALAAIFIASTAFPLPSVVNSPTEARALRQLRIAAGQVGSAMKEDEVALSDQPWIVAWYCDRPAVWIPAAPGGVTKVRKELPKLRWLYLTGQARSWSEDWRTLYDTFQTWNDAQDRQRADRKQPNSRLVVRSGTRRPGFEELQGLAGVLLPDASSPVVVGRFLLPGEMQQSKR